MKARYSVLRVFYWLLIAVTTAGAVGWMLNTYLYSDDLAYTHEYTVDPFWLELRFPIEHWSQVADSIVNHYNLWAARLSNLMLFPLAMFPRAVSEVLCGLLIGVMFWLLLRVGRLKREYVSLRWLALAVAMLWLAFPWYENFQSVAYQLNYVLPSIMMLSTILLLRDGSRLAWLTALMTGWCHEGFGTVLVSLLFFMWIARPSRRRLIFTTGIAAVAGLVLVMSPGTLSRMKGTSGHYFMSLWSALVRLFSQAWSVWVAGILLVVYLWRRKDAADRGEVLRSVLPLAGATAVAWLQTVVLRGEGRAFFPAIICSVAVSLILVSELVGRGRPGRPAVAAASLATVFYVVWLVGVIRVAARVSGQQRELHQIAAASPSDTTSVIFADIDTYSIPYWTIGLTTSSDYYQYLYSLLLSHKYHIGDDRVVIMPRAFAGKPYDEWPPIPGNAGTRGVWPSVTGDTLHGETYEMSTCRRARLAVTLGQPLPSCTPFERLMLALRRAAGSDVDHLVLGAEAYPVVIDGVGRVNYVFDRMPRGYANREVLRIDTVK